jgi:hypothetical protein
MKSEKSLANKPIFAQTYWQRCNLFFVPAKILSPVAILCTLLLVGCSSGPSAACIDLDKKLRLLDRKVADALEQASRVAEFKNSKIQEKYDFCLSNPPRFLNNPQNYWLGIAPADSCGEWSRVQDWQDSNPKSTEESRSYKSEARILRNESPECFDKDGFIKN